MQKNDDVGKTGSFTHLLIRSITHMSKVDPLTSLCKCGEMISIISKPDDLGGTGKQITLPVPILPALRSIGRVLFAVETTEVVDTQHQLRLELSLKCIFVQRTSVDDTIGS